jgi:hypothetical protein
MWKEVVRSNTRCYLTFTRTNCDKPQPRSESGISQKQAEALPLTWMVFQRWNTQKLVDRYILIMHFVQRMHNKLSYWMCAIQNCKAIPCYPYGCNTWRTLAFWRFRILAVRVFGNAIQVIRAVLHITGPCTQQNRILRWIVRHTATNTYHHRTVRIMVSHHNKIQNAWRWLSKSRNMSRMIDIIKWM